MIKFYLKTLSLLLLSSTITANVLSYSYSPKFNDYLRNNEKITQNSGANYLALEFLWGDQNIENVNLVKSLNQYLGIINKNTQHTQQRVPLATTSNNVASTENINQVPQTDDNKTTTASSNPPSMPNNDNKTTNLTSARSDEVVNQIQNDTNTDIVDESGIININEIVRQSRANAQQNLADDEGIQTSFVSDKQPVENAPNDGDNISMDNAVVANPVATEGVEQNLMLSAADDEDDLLEQTISLQYVNTNALEVIRGIFENNWNIKNESSKNLNNINITMIFDEYTRQEAIDMLGLRLDVRINVYNNLKTILIIDDFS